MLHRLTVVRPQTGSVCSVEFESARTVIMQSRWTPSRAFSSPRGPHAGPKFPKATSCKALHVLLSGSGHICRRKSQDGVSGAAPSLLSLCVTVGIRRTRKCPQRAGADQEGREDGLGPAAGGAGYKRGLESGKHHHCYADPHQIRTPGPTPHVRAFLIDLSTGLIASIN